MSEQFEDHGLFERLATSMQDPYVERKLEQVRIMSEYLNSGEFDEDEKKRVIEELDKDWIYMNRPLVVSGAIWKYSIEEERVVRTLIREQEVTSRGFFFDPERTYLDGECQTGKPMPALAFQMKNEEDPNKTHFVAMHLNDIDFIHYPFPSAELRTQRFLYDSPELAKEIEKTVFYSRHTTDMISDLCDLVYFERDSRDQFAMEEVADLESYLDATMNLDRDLPYRMMMLGDVVIVNEKGEGRVNTLVEPTKRLAIIKGVRMFTQDMSRYGEDGHQTYVPYIEAKLYERQEQTEVKHALIPFSSIMHAESVRTEW